MNKRFAWILILAILVAPDARSDPFLEPQPLPDDLKQLTFQDSETGKSVTVRLDENHLPVKQDFFNEDVPIPFFIEGFLVESESGNELHAWRVAPKSGFNGVSILLLHGNGGNILTNLGGGVALGKLGFKVTLVDYSGYGYSSGEATRENLLEDAVSTLGLVAGQAHSSGEKLVLYGQSLGGHLAVVVAARHPGNVDGLVIEGAFASHKAIASEHKGRLGGMLVSEPYSAEESIGDYSKPILVIHSREDEVIPYSMGLQLFETANEPKEFFEIGHPHLAGLAVYAEPIAKKILQLVGSADLTDASP